MAIVDALLKLEGDKAYCVLTHDVTYYSEHWKDIVNRLLPKTNYRKTSRKVLIPGILDTLVSSGLITTDQRDSLRVLRASSVAMRRQWKFGLREGLRDILGKDPRGDVWRIETFPWSTYELSNYLIIRVEVGNLKDLDETQYVYWKRDLDLNISDISDIEDSSVVWNPQYANVYSGRLFYG